MDFTVYEEREFHGSRERRELQARSYGEPAYTVYENGGDGIAIGYTTEYRHSGYLASIGRFGFDEAEALADEIRATVARAKLKQLKEAE